MCILGEQGGLVQADRGLHRRPVRGLSSRGTENQAKPQQVSPRKSWFTEKSSTLFIFMQILLSRLAKLLRQM